MKHKTLTTMYGADSRRTNAKEIESADKALTILLKRRINKLMSSTWDHWKEPTFLYVIALALQERILLYIT